MIKTVIIDDNIQYCKHIINHIISKSKNMQVIYIATDGEEALNVLEKKAIDLVILDLKIPKISGLEILKNIEQTKKDKISGVFCISADNELLHSAYLYSKQLNADFSNKMEPIETTYNKIQKLANEIENSRNSEKVKAIVQKELETIGFNKKYKGTRYLLEAIMYVYSRGNLELLENLEKYVYQPIAIQNKTKAQNIKTNIVKVCEIVYLYQDKEAIKSYFLFDIKPTPKLVMTQIMEKIYKKNEQKF